MSRIRARWVVPAFVILWVGHFILATANWSSGFMIGHEFRQAQTALITDYIDRQNNFGLYYETPILGRPWAFPLELPFYQWCVVGVKRALDIPDFQAARGVSLACFYLTLPALFWLLGAFRVPRPARLLILAPLLACPIYLFYSRSFLIDPMAAMFSAWFLAAFVHTLEERKWWWFALATVAGSLAILIKSLVFAVWLFPAALFGAWTLWSDIRAKAGAKRIAATMGWGIGPTILPYFLFREWLHFTDALKASHPGAYQFTSTELSQGNFGTFSLGSRLDPETWRILAERWSETVGPAWFIGLTLVVGLLLNLKWWRPIAGLTGLWLFGQLAFPYAYAFQDYYFYAGSFFLMLAFGVVFAGLLSRAKAPVWLMAVLACLPLGGMFAGYWNGYGKMQRVVSNGGSGMTAMLADMLPEDSVIMGLGFDWSAIIPYYSKRRALMVRDAQRFDMTYLRGAIDALTEEHVSALLVTDKMEQEGSHVVSEVVERLGLIPTPMMRHNMVGQGVDIYISPIYFEQIAERMSTSVYPNVELILTELPPEGIMLGERRISPGTSRVAFPMINQHVVHFDIFNGYRVFPIDGRPYLNFHPISSLTVVPEKFSGTATWSYGIFDDAWNREGDRSDGVAFKVEVENLSGQRREIFKRELRPHLREEDRGVITSVIPYSLEPGEALRFSSSGLSNMAFDWAYLVEIQIPDHPDPNRSSP